MSPEQFRLWEAWRTGRDGSAFATLVRPDLGRAMGFARRLGCGAADAEDAVQEALVRLALETSDDVDRVGVRAWFFRAVRDRARVIRRSEGRRRQRERKAALPEARSEEPPLHAREQVERALAALDEDDREAVTLRYLQDLDYAEMAVVLRCTTGACRLRVHRALARLRGRFGPGAASMVAALPLPLYGEAGLNGVLTSVIHSAQGIHVAAGAGGASATATATMGGGAMAVTAKSGTVVAAWALVAVAGVWGGMAVLAPVEPGTGEGVHSVAQGTGPSPPAMNEEVGHPSAQSTGSPPPAADDGATPRDDIPPGLSDMKPTSDEVAMLREFLARERERKEKARIPEDADGMRVLAAHRSGGDVESLLWDGDDMRRRVRTGGNTVRIGAPAEGEKLNLAEAAAGADVVELGPGRFVLDSRSAMLLDVRKGSRSFELRGAGMDRTVIVPPEGQNALFHVWEVGALVNLLVRDLTVEGGPRGAGLLDVRGEAAAVVENVRFRGWMAAGHGAPLAASGSAFLAVRNCEFLGEGRRVYAISCRGPVLALLEGCLFSGLEGAIIGSSFKGPAGHVHVKDGRFENAPLSDRSLKEDVGSGTHLAVRGATVRHGAPGLSLEERAKAWGAQHAEELRDVTWEPGTPVWSLATMATVAARMRGPSQELPILIQPEKDESGGSCLYVSVLATNMAQKRAWLVTEDGSRAPQATKERGGGWSLEGIESLDGILSLDEAVRRSGVNANTDVSQAGLGGRGSGERFSAVWYIRGSAGWPNFTIDARTGELQK